MKKKGLFNQMVEASLNADLSKNESKVHGALMMQTIGYGKKSDNMTHKRLRGITKIRMDRMLEALKSVIKKGLFDCVESTSFDYCYSIPEHYDIDKLYTPHVPNFGENSRKKESSSEKQTEFPKNGDNTDLTPQSLSTQPQPQTPQSESGGGGEGGKRENKKPTPPQPSLIGSAYHPYCPYDNFTDPTQTKTVAHEKRIEGVVLAVKFDDNSVAQVVNGEVIGFKLVAMETPKTPTTENPPQETQTLQNQANHAQESPAQAPQTQVPPLPSAISAANQPACQKALHGLSEEQRKAVIDTFLDKQKTSTIRRPAGLFITLAHHAKKGTLIVAEAPSNPPSAPSDTPPTTHPSHRQEPEEDDQEEREHQACRWLYDHAESKRQSSIEALAKEANMERLLKTAAYFRLLKWMNSSKKRE